MVTKEIVIVLTVNQTNNHLQSNEISPAAALAANPMGHIVRPPSRGADSVDSGLLSLVEHEQYNKSRDSPRYNNPNNVVGIVNGHNNQIDTSLDRSPSNSPIDALSDLIASLSNGSDKQSPNSTASAWQVLTPFFFICFFLFCFVSLNTIISFIILSIISMNFALLSIKLTTKKLNFKNKK